MLKDIADVPVVAGFGIRNEKHVKDIGEVADGVVIGSEIVKRLAENDDDQFKQYVNGIRRTLDAL